jgi:hypothetical protein
MAIRQKYIALFLACYILLGSVLPQMDFSQLTRLGTLRTHYLDHVDEAEALGESCHLADFLYEHFICNHDDHEEEDRKDCHKDLPLNGINSSISPCLFVGISSSLEINSPISKAPAFGSVSPHAGFLTGVFQPPS